MNITSMVAQAFGSIISSYWWLILLLMLLSFLKTSFMKGVIGEFQVNLATNRHLDKNIYTLFKNVTLPTEDGTTQIDHIIVSKYGIFVVETKNYKGWIFGSAQQKRWTQKIFRTTSTFQNPLHQNYKHTQTLQSALELGKDKVLSVIVFVGDSTFKTAMPENVVDSAREYIRYIKNKNLPLLSNSEVLSVCTKIKSGRLKPSIRTHVNHVRHVKEIVEAKSVVAAVSEYGQGQEIQQDDNSCEKCGKPMILRTTRKGDNQGKQFWGCSDFPRCRVVKQVV
jgi:restriction system protein